MAGGGAWPQPRAEPACLEARFLPRPLTLWLACANMICLICWPLLSFPPRSQPPCFSRCRHVPVCGLHGSDPQGDAGRPAPRGQARLPAAGVRPHVHARNLGVRPQPSPTEPNAPYHKHSRVGTCLPPAPFCASVYVIHSQAQSSLNLLEGTGASPPPTKASHSAPPPHQVVPHHRL